MLDLLTGPEFLIIAVAAAVTAMIYIFGVLSTLAMLFHEAWKFVAAWALLDYATDWTYQPMPEWSPLLTGATDIGELTLQRLAIAGVLWLIFGRMTVIQPTRVSAAGRQLWQVLSERRRQLMNGQVNSAALRKIRPTNDTDLRDQLRAQYGSNVANLFDRSHNSRGDITAS
ncbi:hypothetical protein KC878_02860 [Candidatus Saccharibacteria bacterium]|nr:hypothetical protein [Candidatus Saccharibacteria bacterium]MCB9821326.1 hypothetical protein [Candidatus Nomurabacteria bacterium]